MKWKICSLTWENIYKSCDKLTGWAPPSEEWAGQDREKLWFKLWKMNNDGILLTTAAEVEGNF